MTTNANLFATLHDAPPQPEYASVELAADDDIAIEVGDRVSVFLPGAYQPRTATVQAVRGDGQYLVHFAFGCTRWVWGQDIVLRVKALALDGEAAAVGEAG